MAAESDNGLYGGTLLAKPSYAETAAISQSTTSFATFEMSGIVVFRFLGDKLKGWGSHQAET
jgi:hypothetical protein